MDCYIISVDTQEVCIYALQYFPMFNTTEHRRYYHYPNMQQRYRWKKTVTTVDRGHFFIVRGGGHIDTWQPLYK